MDALSLIMDDIRLTGVEYLYTALVSPWELAVDTEGLAAFHLVLQNELWLRLPGAADIHLEAGDLVTIPAGIPHVLHDGSGSKVPAVALNALYDGHRTEPVIFGSGPTSALLLTGRCCFDVALSRPLMSALPDHMIIRGVDKNPPEWLRIGLEFLTQEVMEYRPGRDTIINRLFGIMLVECVRDHVNSLSDAAQSWLLALRDPSLSAVLSAIHGDPARAWTVPELAKLACLSRSALAERFSQRMGQPPLSYLAEHRMRLASWQLRYSRQPICRIAEMVGYSSENAFGQAFKRAYGSSPSRYRQDEGRKAEALGKA